MKSRGSSLASVKHFLHISPEGASTIPCISQPILWNHMFLWTPESPWQFVVDIGIIHRGYPACTHTWGKHIFCSGGALCIQRHLPLPTSLLQNPKWVHGGDSSLQNSLTYTTRMAKPLYFPSTFLLPFPISEFILILIFLSLSCHWSPSPSPPFTSHSFIALSEGYENEV